MKNGKRWLFLLLCLLLGLSAAGGLAVVEINLDDPQSVYDYNMNILDYYDELFAEYYAPQNKEHFLLQFGWGGAMEGAPASRTSVLMARVEISEKRSGGSVVRTATVLETLCGNLPDSLTLSPPYPDELPKKGEWVIQLRARPAQELDLYREMVEANITGEVAYEAIRVFTLDEGGNLTDADGAWFSSLEELRAADSGYQFYGGNKNIFAAGDQGVYPIRLKAAATITDEYGVIRRGSAKKWDALLATGQPYEMGGQTLIQVLLDDGFGAIPYSAVNLPNSGRLALLSPYAGWREVHKSAEVRSESGGGGQLLARLRKGVLAAQVGPEQDGYVLVQAGGHRGYAPASALSKSYYPYSSPPDGTGAIDALIQADSDGDPNAGGRYPDWYGSGYIWNGRMVYCLVADTPEAKKAELRSAIEGLGCTVREVRYGYQALLDDQRAVGPLMTPTADGLGIQGSSVNSMTNALEVLLYQPSAAKIAAVKQAVALPEALRIYETDTLTGINDDLLHVTVTEAAP